MSTLQWILVMGFAMSLLALVGSLALLLPDEFLKKIITPLVAFAAGTLLGGALFHMIPSALASSNHVLEIFLWVSFGFSSFFFMEQFLNWHHCHRTTSEHVHVKEPITYMILLADALHKFMGGMGMGSAFVIDYRVGMTTWLAAALHELPQELGDFGILLHGGWKKKEALLFNFLSALTFPLGGVVAYYLAKELDVSFILPFAAGNFLYIATADLIPEIKRHEKLPVAALHFAAFIGGLILLYVFAGQMTHGH